MYRNRPEHKKGRVKNFKIKAKILLLEIFNPSQLADTSGDVCSLIENLKNSPKVVFEKKITV